MNSSCFFGLETTSHSAESGLPWSSEGGSLPETDENDENDENMDLDRGSQTEIIRNDSDSAPLLDLDGRIRQVCLVRPDGKD